jgi:hypothetical protein
MKQSKRPLWKKSMLQALNYDDIVGWLDEIMDNGDMYGYDRDEDGYYREYKELFDDLSGSAYSLWEALQGSDVQENWDDMTVALLGYSQKVLGFDAVEQDYYSMMNSWDEDWAVQEAVKRIERLPKRDMIRCFRNVMTTLVLFFDIKAAHDCLTSIVEELDQRGAILQRKNDEINRLYKDLTGANEADFDRIIASMPQRMWIE